PSTLNTPPLAGATLSPYTTLFRSRLRQALCHLRRADRRECANLALAFAFQEASERAQAGQRPHQRSPADLVRAAHRHEGSDIARSEEHTSELQSRENLVCRLLLQK